MNIQKRQDIEKQVVRNLIQTAAKHGYRVVKVDYGDEIVPVSDETGAMDAVFAVDDCTIRFRHPDEPKSHCAVIVLGNDGWDAIADSSLGGKWDAVMAECDAFSDKLQEQFV